MKNYVNLDFFVIYMRVDGFIELEYKSRIFKLNKGEIIVLPTSID